MKTKIIDTKTGIIIKEYEEVLPINKQWKFKLIDKLFYVWDFEMKDDVLMVYVTEPKP